MKNIIILSILVALSGANSFAGQKDKREREDFSLEIERLEEQLKGKGQTDQESILLDVSVEKVADFVHSMDTDQELLDKHLDVYNALRQRVLVKTIDGQVRHYRVDVLDQLELFQAIPDAEKKATINQNKALPLKEAIPTAQDFATLYTMLISMYTKGANKVDSLGQILHRGKLSGVKALHMFDYLGLEKQKLSPLLQLTSRELEPFKSAFPHVTTGPVGLFYLDRLPPEFSTLPLVLLGGIMRAFYLEQPNETKVRLKMVCYSPEDKFCLKQKNTVLPISPFSIADLIVAKKIKSAQHTTASPQANSNLNVWDLKEMYIGDLTGIDSLQRIKELSLSGNQLSMLPDNFLAQAIDLKSLFLQKNRLSQLPPNFLAPNRWLDRINLDNNELQSLPANFMVDCRMLTGLSLAGNRLRTLPANFLSVCPNLQDLHLENNFLPPEVIDQIRNRLTAQGKVVDGVRIVLEPQRMEQDNPPPGD